ncbi:hypothetical protein PM10SUCC1_33790 [Propionigenium maris DSM 9537]|uniref:Uncharacterized protein n=1 Tax=Propionigenium maris DSM 9537 TaxID=1123000 RepID=A0A9W6GPB3_9FUSO|nr:hypothetical protein [Propionigenium maris]GLI57865.1 hypothetical protein PM10SUCC1_33790 [Propionigenium maris DSM 9537]
MKIIIAILFILLNIFIIPVGVTLGAFSMDAPSSTHINFFLVSTIVIGIPNLLLVLFIYLIKKVVNIRGK